MKLKITKGVSKFLDSLKNKKKEIFDINGNKLGEIDNNGILNINNKNFKSDIELVEKSK